MARVQTPRADRPVRGHIRPTGAGRVHVHSSHIVQHAQHAVVSLTPCRGRCLVRRRAACTRMISQRADGLVAVLAIPMLGRVSRREHGLKLRHDSRSPLRHRRPLVVGRLYFLPLIVLQLALRHHTHNPGRLGLLFPLPARHVDAQVPLWVLHVRGDALQQQTHGLAVYPPHLHATVRRRRQQRHRRRVELDDRDRVLVGRLECPREAEELDCALERVALEHTLQHLVVHVAAAATADPNAPPAGCVRIL
mmetsp:Transcript_90913/g.259495  ORF Transcript_90913/g.259495 Transcript_90913/m.259495 type:complete len:250 (+) Transcript_90913:818-1567(+)